MDFSARVGLSALAARLGLELTHDEGIMIMIIITIIIIMIIVIITIITIIEGKPRHQNLQGDPLEKSLSEIPE